MKILTARITGIRPLLMHGDLFADPLNPFTQAHKELTSIRKKSIEDLIAIAKSEWRGGMYWDEKLGPYMPGINFEASLIVGAKQFKLGTTIKKACEVITDMCELEYDGPRDIESLWDQYFYDARSVVVQRAKIMRYRPIFKEWSTTLEIAINEDMLDVSEVIRCFETAGQYAGIGDYRPKFGKYNVEII